MNLNQQHFYFFSFSSATKEMEGVGPNHQSKRKLHQESIPGIMFHPQQSIRGCNSGAEGTTWDNKPRGQVTKIRISHGDSINSIKIQYESNSTPSQHGGDGGSEFTTVDLGSSSLSEITGYYGFHQNNNQKQVVIRSLKFVFDDGREPETFGFTANEGEPFSFMLNGARIGGFHGRQSAPRIGPNVRENSFISAIGIYVETLATTVPRGPNLREKNDDKFIKVGTQGAIEDQCWDDGMPGKARQIFICHGEYINFIQTAYESNTDIELSPGHGGEGGNKFEVVDLHSASFSWIRVYSVHRQNESKKQVIRSLKFGTNDGREYGPFGNITKAGKHFIAINVLNGAKTGGFYGCLFKSPAPLRNLFVSAIGIYVES
ncbi:hypothetical protein ACLOJK_026518 [Asimina triloba]